MNLLRPGELIAGRYRIERPLGRGGMGAVFLATHTGLNRRVAVKVLDVSVENDPESLERFKREGHAAAAIGHEGVVEVLDTGTTGWGMPFLVMEYLEGPTLRVFYRARGPFEPRVAVAIMVPVLDALAAAHGKGILHRDLKPANVVLSNTPRRQVKLLDFGISKFLRSVTVITRTGVALGTPMYMSPEQMTGEKELTPATDLYSVGVMLFELIAGRAPFLAGNELQLMHLVVNTDAPPLAATAANVPSALSRIIDRQLSRDPRQRSASAAELRRELIAAVEPATDVMWSQVERMVPSSITELVEEAQNFGPVPLATDSPATTDTAVRVASAAFTQPDAGPPVRNWKPFAAGAAVSFIIFGAFALGAIEREAPSRAEKLVEAPAAAATSRAPDPSQLLAQADAELARGNLALAKDLYAQCVRDGQPCIESRRGLTQVNTEMQNLGLLVRADRALLDRDLSHAERLLSAASTTVTFKNRYDDLLARHARAASLPPAARSSPITLPPPPPSSRTEKLLEEAREHNKRNEYDRAKTKLTTCIKLEPHNALCHKLLGSTYALLKDNRKGVAHYKKFVELAPEDPSAPKVQLIIEAYEQSQK